MDKPISPLMDAIDKHGKLRAPRHLYATKDNPSKPYNPWTEEEIKLLKVIFTNDTNKELEEKLYPHPLGSIYLKARRLGLHRDRQNVQYKPRTTLHAFIPVLRKARMDNKLTQEKVAKEIGIDMTALQRYESGRMKLPQLDKIGKWAEYFGYELKLVKREFKLFK